MLISWWGLVCGIVGNRGTGGRSSTELTSIGVGLQQKQTVSDNPERHSEECTQGNHSFPRCPWQADLDYGQSWRLSLSTIHQKVKVTPIKHHLAYWMRRAGGRGTSGWDGGPGTAHRPHSPCGSWAPERSQIVSLFIYTGSGCGEIQPENQWAKSSYGLIKTKELWSQNDLTSNLQSMLILRCPLQFCHLFYETHCCQKLRLLCKEFDILTVLNY